MVHSNGKLIENPLEQKVLRQIYQLRDRGHSLRDIARQVSTPIAPVSFKTVQRILQRGDNTTIGKPNV
jgi:transposase-like protein